MVRQKKYIYIQTFPPLEAAILIQFSSPHMTSLLCKIHALASQIFKMADREEEDRSSRKTTKDSKSSNVSRVNLLFIYWKCSLN